LPDYANKKGRVVAYTDVPETNELKGAIEKMCKEKEGLKCEGNKYSDLNSCGIGFHGDSERRKVVAVRLGASSDLRFQWHLNRAPVGKRVFIPLHHGDLYVMSEKAVGTDWKKVKTYTLRHATGAPTFAKPQSMHVPNSSDEE
jgi:alkylated DNA repair dioxygenase AlkB